MSVLESLFHSTEGNWRRLAARNRYFFF